VVLATQLVGTLVVTGLWISLVASAVDAAVLGGALPLVSYDAE